MAKQKKAIVERKIKKEVTFKLSTKERIDLSDKLEELMDNQDEIIAQFKKVRTDYKGRLEKVALQIRQVRKNRKDGERREVVEVTESRNYDKRTVTFIHKGEKIEERDMTADELQVEMNLEAKEKNKAKETKVQVRDPSDGEVKDVIKLETARKTKKSSLDSTPAPRV